MEVRALTEADAEGIATWRYPGRYSTYDVGEIRTPVQGVWAVEHEGEFVGYCCIGPGARVPGVDEEEGILDVGYGMRPDLMGQGRGRAFVRAILEWAVGEFGPRQFRLLILTWNERSRKGRRGARVRGRRHRPERRRRLLRHDAARVLLGGAN